MLQGSVSPHTNRKCGDHRAMQSPVKERVQKLRQEIAEITDANRSYANRNGKNPVAASEQERRLERLQQILDELRALTDWKET